jgi:hypothetical protein
LSHYLISTSPGFTLCLLTWFSTDVCLPCIIPCSFSTSPFFLSNGTPLLCSSFVILLTGLRLLPLRCTGFFFLLWNCKIILCTTYSIGAFSEMSRKSMFKYCTRCKQYALLSSYTIFFFYLLPTETRCSCSWSSRGSVPYEILSVYVKAFTSRRLEFHHLLVWIRMEILTVSTTVSVRFPFASDVPGCFLWLSPTPETTTTSFGWVLWCSSPELSESLRRMSCSMSFFFCTCFLLDSEASCICVS